MANKKSNNGYDGCGNLEKKKKQKMKICLCK